MNKRDKILSQMNKPPKDRGPRTVYLSAKLFEEFKKSCGEHSASQVLELLMRDFVGEKRKK